MGHTDATTPTDKLSQARPVIAGASSLPDIARDLVRSGSLEMGADRPTDARAVAELLPAGTPVLVNHLPRHTLADTLSGLKSVHDAGLEPVPHVAARRVTSRAELHGFLADATRRAGVTKLLLIGGDTATVSGPYPDANAVLTSGLIAEAGIREIALAGYPEGHPLIDAGILDRALDEKISIASAQGLGIRVITQFSFTPNRVLDFCASLQRRHPHVPVYVGIAGPASPAALLRFATACGVGASFRAMTNHGMGALRLVTHTGPEEQLAMIAGYLRGHPQANIVGVHFYTFGGVSRTANWMNSVLRG